MLISDKSVRLQITTEKTGFTLQKVYGHPNTSGNFQKFWDWQPAVVVPTYRANLTVYDPKKEDRVVSQLDLTRDATYYLGRDSSGRDWCRNIAFEPQDANNNVYITDEVHFPPLADPIIKGYILMELEKNNKPSRSLHAEPVSMKNPYGPELTIRPLGNIAHDCLFHIGGFYEARISAGHAKWLGGSEGCFAFIPKESVSKTENDAAKVAANTEFYSNKKWVSVTDSIDAHRKLDSKNRFFVELAKRSSFSRDSCVEIIKIARAFP
ncbi:hypothetical protein PPMP20_07915 [Paraburkholderia phymatum]|uniref:hypothetical protein n=1 Tax=Paraburkholderia phymatum TaxID=148447 RepID=UPI0012FD5644|nr:hypothetical protein [Paraburkholderia phymatum]